MARAFSRSSSSRARWARRASRSATSRSRRATAASCSAASASRRLSSFSHSAKKSSFCCCAISIAFGCSTGRGARVAGKLALYKAVLSEYQPDHVRNAFELATFVNDRHHSLVLRADTTEAMHEWLNAVLRQKLAIEDTIDNLTL